MPEYDNEKRGVLFKNKKKETDQHPDHTGSCEIEGVKYWLSAWIKESQKGDRFMSIAFTKAEDKPAATERSTKAAEDFF